MAESQSFWSCSKGKCLCVTTLKTDQYYYFIANRKLVERSHQALLVHNLGSNEA